MAGKGRLTEPVLVHRIIARLNVGGPAMHVVHLSAGLDSERFRTRLIAGSITRDEGDMAYFADAHGVEVTELPAMSRLVSPFDDLKTFFGLFRLFRRERPTIVHTHTAKAGTLGRLAAILAGVPVRVHTFHGHVLGGGYFSAWKTGLYRGIERVLARWTHRLVVLTEHQANEMSGDLRLAARDRFAVIPLGLELERFRAWDREAVRAGLREELRTEAPLVGIVGRLVAVKNHGLLFDAVVRLRAEWGDAADGPPPELVIVGAGMAEAELRERAEACGLGDAIHWLGWRDGLEAVVPALDVLALSSVDEGTPVAVLEALAARVPVVATAVGGVPEVLEDGRWGRLVPPGDAAALATALRAALRDPPSAAEAEEASLHAVERYRVARLVADVEALYGELIPGVVDGRAHRHTHGHADGLATEPADGVSDGRAEGVRA